MARRTIDDCLLRGTETRRFQVLALFALPVVAAAGRVIGRVDTGLELDEIALLVRVRLQPLEASMLLIATAVDLVGRLLGFVEGMAGTFDIPKRTLLGHAGIS